MITELYLIVEDHRRKANRLIREKVRWQYTAHRGMTRQEIQQKLDEYDARIREEQSQVLTFNREYRDALRGE